MEEYLIYASIGGLLFLTLFINSVSEAYEQKQRQRRIKILRLKHGLDELSEFLEKIKSCNVTDEINKLFASEITLRLQTIQQLDPSFRGIESLLEEAEKTPEHPSKEKSSFAIKDESQFKEKMILIRKLIKLLSNFNWHTKTNPNQLKQFTNELKLLRCEKIFEYYSDKASQDFQNDNMMKAKEDYYYILHALKQSGITKHARVIELNEQVEFMMDQLGKTPVKQKAEDEVAQLDTDQNNDNQVHASENNTQQQVEQNNETEPH